MTDAARATVADLVRSRADDHSTGLRFEGAEWTWAEVVAEMAVRARWLRAALADGGPPHVGVLLDNVPEYLFLLGGAALSGAVLVGINPTRQGDELARDIRHVDCRLIVTDAEHAELLDGLDLGAVGERVLISDDAAYGPELDAHRPAGASGVLDDLPPPSADDLYLLIFTSGSTGAPKAVRMTQGRAGGSDGAVMGFTPDDVLYCAMPLFHGNALASMVFPAFGTGATLVLRRRFSASAWLPEIRAEHVTFTSTIGRVLTYLLATPETEHDRDHDLKFVLAPESSAVDMKTFKRRFGVAVFGGYGSSENAVILSTSPGMPPDALGVPAPGTDVAVVDPDTGEECPRARFDDDGRLLNAEEAIGEIVGRDALQRFEGYYANDEAAAARSRNGWYWSGDLAYRDADGVFHFAGRNADWLRVDGENFAAAPVERILRRSPGVTGVAVFGVPDDRTVDDQVMAVLELDADAAAGFDPAAFDAFLAEQRDLGTKWSPRYLRLARSLPVTATNKVDKAPLRRDRWTPDGDADPVYWRPDRRDPLRAMTDADRDDVRERFAASGRLDRLER
ncbi:MAG TPA: AMP-binding protein [Acidimicrobiales bacterium]|nr:AMP-binding protein [Acidimicrobiales bacterium]